MARKNLGYLAREDDEVVGADIPADSGEATLDAIVDSPEADVAEAGEIAGEIEDLVNNVDAGEEDAGDLEAAGAAIDATQAEGGLSAPAAEAISILYGIIARQHGVPMSQQLSKESFDSKTSRRQATEGLADKIKEGGKAIWKLIQKAWEKAKAWTTKWFNKFFDGATKLKDRAVKLKKLATQKGSKAPSKAEFDNEKLAVSLAMTHSGAVGNAGELKHWLDTGAASISGTKGVDDAAAISEELATMITDLIDKMSDEAGFKSATQSYLNTKIRSGNAVEVKNGDDDRDYFATFPTLGGKVVVRSVLKSEGDSAEAIAEALGSVRVELKDDVDAKAVTKTELKTLTGPECVGICASVEKLADALINTRNRIKKIEEKGDAVRNSAKRAESNANKAEKEDAAELGRLIRKVVTGFLAASTGGIAVQRSYNLTSGNHILNYVAESLKQIDAKKDKKDKDDIS
jgi:hypothetical protein